MPPTRKGVRGGAADFKWDDVKESHHRANYLGNSLMAPVGRWQQGRDLQWYAKASDGAAAATESLRTQAEQERAAIKQAEEAAMRETLGVQAQISPLVAGFGRGSSLPHRRDARTHDAADRAPDAAAPPPAPS
ncbi:hypothetical protein CXG81DRAFT_23367 [Caulochytrium protostelioides]|uniref:Multiple myeloma tumor-associated protein 2-like N-terminal domain-containing protein n=1 Tax=Caulochytrium protostelioides TaxID=1555241 RepID=A0A4P9XEI3_9FUNG|nr:hypothetical protein CXG81DRAFT_23367 [Caulochytrium protostelioides]|eukprot:RKP03954.1 hypothetical protein CXG81DRAFT_23367 [Caulochytrium protostelioides]